MRTCRIILVATLALVSPAVAGEPERSGNLTGRVVLPADIEPGHVVVRAFDPSGTPAGAVRPDKDGIFRLGGLAAGEWAVRLEAPGLPSLALPPVEVLPGRTIDVGTVFLRNGSTVRGTVVDAETGEPVPGARVRVIEADRITFYSRAGRGAWVEPSFGAGEDGTFAIPGVAPGILRLEVSAPGHGAVRVSLDVNADTDPEPLVVSLPAAARLRGVVLDSAGRPVAGARVTVSIPEADDFRSAATAENGTWRFNDLPPGSATVVALLPGNPPSTITRKVTLRAGREESLELAPARERVVVSGTMRIGHRPLRGFLAATSGNETVEGRAGDDGAFELELPAPGKWSIVALGMDPQAPRRNWSAEFVLDIPPGRARVERDLVFPSGAFHGRVVDATGAPLASVKVHAWALDRVPTLPGGPATTGEDGTWRIEGIAAGRWKLLFVKQGFAFHVAGPVRARDEGDVRVDAVLEPAEPLRVRVVGPSGEPVPGARLFLLDPDPDALPVPTDAIPTDEAGEVRLDLFPPGSWSFACWHSRRGFALLDVVLPLPPDRSLEVLRYEETVPVDLRVRDRSGAPVPRAALAGLAPDHGPPLDSVLAALVGSAGRAVGGLAGDDGRMTVPPLPPGRWIATVRCPGVEEPVSVRFRVAGTERIEVDVTCPAEK